MEKAMWVHNKSFILSKKYKIIFNSSYHLDIQYEEMKAMLAEATQDAPSAEIVEPEVLLRHFAKFDEDFFTFCKKGKCIQFYKKQ